MSVAQPSRPSQSAFASTEHQLSDALARAERVRRAFESCGRVKEASTMAELAKAIESGRFTVGIVGEAKRGKSTLINGLLGRKDDMLAPVGRAPATNVATFFSNGDTEKVMVTFAKGGSSKEIRPEDIRNYACEEFNPGNRKGVTAIDVTTDAPRLGRHAVMADTPGAANALSKLHSDVLFDCLPGFHAVIFLVTADEPLVESEVELLRSIRKKDIHKVLFAINKADRVEPEELDEAMEHNRKVLAACGLSGAPIFAISARRFQQEGVDEGTERLFAAVDELICESANEAMAERLRDVAGRMTAEAVAEVQAELALHEMSLKELAQGERGLAELSRSLERTVPVMERKFQSAWCKAVGEYEDALNTIETGMVTEFLQRVEKAGSTVLTRLSKTIPAEVLKRSEELLAGPAEKMGRALDEAALALQVEYNHGLTQTTKQLAMMAPGGNGIRTDAEILAAGGVPLAGAFVAASLPGLVGSVVISSAPAVATAIWWNPFTWCATAGTALANGAVTTAGAASATLLAPLAAVGAPLLVSYACLRVVGTWKAKVEESRSHLSHEVKALIMQMMQDLRRDAARLRDRDQVILAEFAEQTMGRLSACQRQVAALEGGCSTPEKVASLKLSLDTLQNIQQ